MRNDKKDGDDKRTASGDGYSLLSSGDEEEDEETVVAEATPVVVPSAPTEEALLVRMVEESTEEIPPWLLNNNVVGRENSTDFTQTGQFQTSHTDVLAEEAAAEAREQGVTMIRDHLASYLVQNPDASYVTWIATLHPENAEVIIDPRFLIPGNPWVTVFEESRAAAAMAAGVPQEDYVVVQDEGEQQQQGEVKTDEDHHQQQQQRYSSNLYHGGLIPMIIGFALIVGSVATTLSLQLASTIIYLLAVVCAAICHHCLAPFNACSAVLYILPGGLLILFQTLDLLLLVLDTLLVELLALLAYLLCTPLAFSHAVGVFYHQMIRRLPHYVRWACRKPFVKMNCRPKRAAFPSVVGHATAGEGEAAATRLGFQRVTTATADDDSSAGGVP